MCTVNLSVIAAEVSNYIITLQAFTDQYYYQQQQLDLVCTSRGGEYGLKRNSAAFNYSF